MTLGFGIATTNINLVAIGKFFNKICIAIFDHLLAVEYIEDKLFGLLLTYFETMRLIKKVCFTFITWF